jgi:phosphopantetheinyl transferase (holo-ACP synthase)
VDLNDPHNTGKSRNTPFINRVFTPDEQKQIFCSDDQDAILWALWAGKETAYKIISKDDPGVSSAPRRYEVRLFRYQESDGETCLLPDTSHADGFVETPNGRVHIRIFINHDYAHCIGTADSAETIDSVVWHTDEISSDRQSLPDHESIFVRNALKEHLSALCDTSPEDIEIRRVKDQQRLGPPMIYINGRKSEIDISLSHDGRFAAYAFAANNVNH